jgi:hypothetical protein
MTTEAIPSGTTSGTPQLLLVHHLKQLKLPTVLRGVCHIGGFYLLLLCPERAPSCTIPTT